MAGLRFPALKTMVMIACLVLSLAPPALPFVVTASLATVTSVASQVVSAGASLAGTTLSAIANTEYSCTCAVQVENWSRHPLLYPTVQFYGGAVLSSTSVGILPGKREAFATRKLSGTATGTNGVAFWNVGDTNRLFVVMWSVPYDYNYYSNWMGVGMTREGVTNPLDDYSWFEQMYWYNSTDDLSFERGEFYWLTNPVVYSNEYFEAVASMTNIHNAEIKITFRPIAGNWADLALPIQDILQSLPEPSSNQTSTWG
ncbi:tereporin-Ca1-like [Babylonia areolata]|uniref:tereporin-Ca1-like n=1 Tax=Babylonia areolata TaxID=304850 RepID=UPI003FD5F8CA